MLTPTFSFKVEDNSYSIIPTFGLMCNIEDALGDSIGTFVIERTKNEKSFNIKGREILKIFKLLPCNKDFNDDKLGAFIFNNPAKAQVILQNLFSFLLIPGEQEKSVKKK